MGPGGMGRPPMGPPPGGRPRGRMPHAGGMPPADLPRIDDFTEQDFDLEQMEQESEEMIQLIPLSKENASFQDTSGGDLLLHVNGTAYEHIQLVETFPLTDPYVYISVRDSRNKNKEIGLIEDLNRDFDTETVARIQKHLSLRYHMPKIEKIVRLQESGGYSNFTVLTDCGEAQFSLRANGSHVTVLSDTRLIIQDIENNRFEIPDKTRLSPKELKKLDLFL